MPHLLNITDSWMPHYKVAGARMMGHVINTSPASELQFYGRAELLEESLARLLGHTDSEVMEAAGEPLLALTSIRHEATSDQLIQELVTRLELARDKDMREVVATIMEQLLRIAWPGRWTTSCPLWSSLCTRCPGDTRARTRPQRPQ